jgi:aminopeptidase
MERAAQEGSAVIAIAGASHASIFEGADPGRMAGARFRDFDRAWADAVMGQKIAWAILAYPTEEWAREVFGEPDVDRLWDAVAHSLRLDAPDPAAAWEERVQELDARARALTERRLSALRYRGPGTDLEVGLIEGGRWIAARQSTERGQAHVPNLPTEEVFTTPDRTRADGVVRMTTELELNGRIVRGLELRFEQGILVDATAESGVEVVRGELESDEGASHLGEIALVDATSRVGQLGRVFLNTLFDENASSHIAYGSGFTYCVEGAESLDHEALVEAGVNQSSVHTDVMVGGPEVDVLGLSASGDALPVILHNEWRLG